MPVLTLTNEYPCITWSRAKNANFIPRTTNPSLNKSLAGAGSACQRNCPLSRGYLPGNTMSELNFSDPRFMEIFFELYEKLPRGGPGNRQSTARALVLATGNFAPPGRILDVGCGPGAQTLDLAELSNAHITAIDNHAPFVKKLRQKIQAAGLSGRVVAEVADMTGLHFPERYFDIIWGEGSIYNMGFAAGLSYLSRFLKPGGRIALTEAVWLHDHPPALVKENWAKEYPHMRNIEGNLELMRQAGFKVLGHFTLPADAWSADYYAPMKQPLAIMRHKYSDDEFALRVMDYLQQEIDFYERYHEYFGYEFYIGEKTDLA